MKDRMIELLKSAKYPLFTGYPAEVSLGVQHSNLAFEYIADHLIDNGVIVPPYKVGTKVYVITSQTSNNKNLYIFEDVISHYIVGDYCTAMCFENHLSKTEHNWDKVFLSREDAEKALKEMEKK